MEDDNNSLLTNPGYVTVTVGGGGGGGGGGTGGSSSGWFQSSNVSIPVGNITLGAQGAGSYYVSSGAGTGATWSMSNANMSTKMMSIMAENGGDAIIKTNKHEVNLDEMAEIMETLKERLLVLVPNFEKHEKYPALKEAYEHYKLIEALCKEEDQ